MNKQKIAELLTEYKWKDIPVDEVINKLKPLFESENIDISSLSFNYNATVNFDDIKINTIYLMKFEGKRGVIKITDRRTVGSCSLLDFTVLKGKDELGVTGSSLSNMNWKDLDLYLYEAI